MDKRTHRGRPFEQLGLRVPADLSIAALCPDEVAETAPVPVTSIAIPSAEIGERAVALLMRKPTGAETPQATPLAPRLTVRGEHGPPGHRQAS